MQDKQVGMDGKKGFGKGTMGCLMVWVSNIA